MLAYCADAFTDRAFAGNPAAVCTLERSAKAELVGYQASPRGGVVRVRPVHTRVILVGTAVTVWRGELAAAP